MLTVLACDQDQDAGLSLDDLSDDELDGLIASKERDQANLVRQLQAVNTGLDELRQHRAHRV